jgi:hypothetical protein
MEFHMSLSVKTHTVFGYLFVMDKPHIKKLKKAGLYIAPVCYRWDEVQNKYLVGKSLTEHDALSSVASFDLSSLNLEQEEKSLHELLTKAGVTPDPKIKAKLHVTSYYY